MTANDAAQPLVGEAPAVLIGTLTGTAAPPLAREGYCNDKVVLQFSVATVEGSAYYVIHRVDQRDRRLRVRLRPIRRSCERLSWRA